MLAFFIYGIFNPSWAARLWYNVRTFPQRVTSWISSGKEFLDYDSYKLDISSIWDEIWDKIWDTIDLDDESEFDIELDDTELNDVELYDEEDIETEEIENEVKVKNHKKEWKKDSSQQDDRRAIKAFPRSVKFVEFSELTEKNLYEVDKNLTWYSKSDLLWVINKYIEENLDDDTDILVTVEYEDGDSDFQKVILETRPRISWKWQSVYFSWRLSNDFLDRIDVKEDDNDNGWKNGDVVSSKDNTSNKSSTNQVSNNVKSYKNNNSTKLTQKEIRETEEIFSILF